MNAKGRSGATPARKRATTTATANGASTTNGANRRDAAPRAQAPAPFEPGGKSISNSRTLSDADVDAIAFRVAEVLGRAATESVLVDAAEAASILFVDRGYVYRHAAKLGAVKLGDGPRARLRFPIARLVEMASTRSESRESPPPSAPQRRRSRRARGGLTAAGNPLVTYKPRGGLQ
jgi:hypothetical protein